MHCLLNPSLILGQESVPRMDFIISSNELLPPKMDHTNIWLMAETEQVQIYLHGTSTLGTHCYGTTPEC